MLGKYYGTFEITKVVQNLSIFELLQCFKLQSDIGSHLLSKSPKEESLKPSFNEEFLLQLNDGAEGEFSKLGMCRCFLIGFLT